MKKSISVWKDVDEYWEFTKEHNVFGMEAVKLKKSIDKLANIPLPKIKKTQ